MGNVQNSSTLQCIYYNYIIFMAGRTCGHLHHSKKLKKVQRRKEVIWSKNIFLKNLVLVLRPLNMTKRKKPLDLHHLPSLVSLPGSCNFSTFGALHVYTAGNNRLTTIYIHDPIIMQIQACQPSSVSVVRQFFVISQWAKNGKLNAKRNYCIEGVHQILFHSYLYD